MCSIGREEPHPINGSSPICFLESSPFPKLEVYFLLFFPNSFNDFSLRLSPPRCSLYEFSWFSLSKFFFFFFFTMEMWALKISQWVPPNLSSSFFLPSIYKPFSMLTMCAAIGATFWGGCWMLSMKKLTCSWEKKKKNLREMVDGAKFGNKFQQMKIPTGSH